MPIKTWGWSLALAVLVGCGPRFIESTTIRSIDQTPLQPVAVVPFIVEPMTAGEMRSSAVGSGAASWLTDRWLDRLRKGYVEIRLWKEPADLSGRVIGAPDDWSARAQSIGDQLGTPVVLFGTVDAFKEREGSAVGIRTPASVGFTVRLYRTENGELLWKAAYHETQASLFEDITAINLFLKRKGRWLTAAELADYGLDQIMEKSPWPSSPPASDADHSSN